MLQSFQICPEEVTKTLRQFVDGHNILLHDARLPDDVEQVEAWLQFLTRTRVPMFYWEHAQYVQVLDLLKMSGLDLIGPRHPDEELVELRKAKTRSHECNPPMGIATDGFHVVDWKKAAEVWQLQDHIGLCVDQMQSPRSGEAVSCVEDLRDIAIHWWIEVVRSREGRKNDEDVGLLDRQAAAKAQDRIESYVFDRIKAGTQKVAGLLQTWTEVIMTTVYLYMTGC